MGKRSVIKCVALHYSGARGVHYNKQLCYVINEWPLIWARLFVKMCCFKLICVLGYKTPSRIVEDDSHWWWPAERPAWTCLSAEPPASPPPTLPWSPRTAALAADVIRSIWHTNNTVKSCTKRYCWLGLTADVILSTWHAYNTIRSCTKRFCWLSWT